MSRTLSLGVLGFWALRYIRVLGFQGLAFEGFRGFGFSCACLGDGGLK